ncbi:sugar phosphate isomerase/epimerase [Cytobacillus pseudoceanisediminis]|uniref:Sugar phosphate isomerase/epimerase n=1 Tax=Cytobacillus pseudoceanisediminis TaxID=3051614 RepID=A0ABZ2ZNX7_9BACI|nr:MULTISPECIES: sugar phosphate isomerase/epimerase [Cytobacillus]MBY0158062.1 sugar phosphate isomerase/epimerase [Cytobacillus firmus]MCM3245544.1 sugar phosphate isomerase/epimerase [Cytobacillus oceanisediminis]MCM3394684.1 sugar phosphate isomerase/epimerase [Cytobacillus oceanisediminis]MCM3531546.1 sugar phosphate isomerase/epimerase [Cytobacillus oceanisediminis]MCS0827129.1 sugar phosphate isomerase/epimerase [Cytobacillus firmus]
MKLSLCTISFRHHLQSIDQIAHYAQTNGFQGIEIWGVHAKNLAEDIHYGSEWLSSYNLETTMLSDYLPLDAPLPVLMTEMQKLCAMAHRWGTKKIRTFAGTKGSADISRLERIELVSRMKMLCKMAEAEGQMLLVETHPNTLTDNPSSTLQLIEETDHSALRVNFDVLHIWESGVDPIFALKQLRPYISHFHFKNIQSRSQLGVFAPNNVYAAAGSREGMVSLFEGAVDYRMFLREASNLMEMDASLEWFGPNVKDILTKDSKEIMRVLQAEKAL